MVFHSGPLLGISLVTLSQGGTVLSIISLHHQLYSHTYPLSRSMRLSFLTTPYSFSPSILLYLHLHSRKIIPPLTFHGSLLINNIISQLPSIMSFRISPFLVTLIPRPPSSLLSLHLLRVRYLHHPAKSPIAHHIIPGMILTAPFYINISLLRSCYITRHHRRNLALSFIRKLIHCSPHQLPWLPNSSAFGTLSIERPHPTLIRIMLDPRWLPELPPTTSTSTVSKPLLVAHHSS